MQGAKSHPRPPSLPPTSSRSRKHTVAVPPAPANGPTTALAVLRTHLTGIAQMRFRVAPDEPFQPLPDLDDPEQVVVPPQSSSGLMALPTEVLDEIVFHLDTLRDIRALGLTCQRLRDTVHPRHTEYRLVRCPPSSVHVWRHLAEYPFLARNVRHLHITAEGVTKREIVPSRAKALENQMDVRKQSDVLRDLILCALARMTTLAKFSWSCTSIRFNDISPGLIACSSLHEVEVINSRLFRPLHERARIGGLDLPDVSCVTISGKDLPLHDGALDYPSLDAIQWHLTLHCPNLTTLRIEFDFDWPSPLADGFFSRGRWPRLRTLTLRYFRCSKDTGFNAAAGFLMAHPFIEELDFGLVWMPLVLPVGTLPRLRYLSCDSDVAAAILRCPMTEGQTRPLEVLRGVRIGRGWDIEFMSDLRLCPGLKRVELERYVGIADVKRLAEAAPGITLLNVGGLPEENGNKVVSRVKDWAPVLSVLPELTAFHGVCFFRKADEDAKYCSDRSKIKNNDEVASMLLRICPKLTRVDYWDGSGRVIVLGKEGNKVNWEVRDAES